jgi:hypothetical protein
VGYRRSAGDKPEGNGAQSTGKPAGNSKAGSASKGKKK